MSSTHLLVFDAHAHPSYNNDRADLLGKLIKDVKPDVVINGGDTADMPSLCSYDKGKKSFQGRTYAADIASHSDFQERMWGPLRRSKKRLPRRVVLHGNHDQRIGRAIEIQPELEGTISYNDLDLDRYYDTVVPYNGGTPGSITIDGINYAHYFVTGVSGRAISGEHPAHALITKKLTSCIAGHLHTFSYCVKPNANGKPIMSMIAPCFQDYDSSYAGEANKLWSRGVVILHDVNDGEYDMEYVSMKRLKRVYGSDTKK